MNKLGFTIIEVLIALIVIIISTQVIIIIMLNVNKTNELIKDNSKDVLLIRQLEKDLTLCKKIINIKPFECKTYNEKKIRYKINNKKLIRQINGKGYEVIYSKINDYNVIKDKKIIWQLILPYEMRVLPIGLINE